MVAKMGPHRGGQKYMRAPHDDLHCRQGCHVRVIRMHPHREGEGYCMQESRHWSYTQVSHVAKMDLRPGWKGTGTASWTLGSACTARHSW